ncbi:MAG: hypothetical protein Q9218_007176 [Villophora microphyllina]
MKGSSYPTKVYTDHQALLKTLKSEDSTGRIARWQLAPSEYNLDIYHLPEKDCVLADVLSRIIGYPTTLPTDYETEMTSFSAERLYHGQKDSINEQAKDRQIETLKPDAYAIGTQGGEGRWQKWLEDPWYEAIMENKKGQQTAGRRKSLLQHAAKEVSNHNANRTILIEVGSKGVVACKERKGNLSRWLHEKEVPDESRRLESARNTGRKRKLGDIRRDVEKGEQKKLRNE